MHFIVISTIIILTNDYNFVFLIIKNIFYLEESNINKYYLIMLQILHFI